MKVSEWLHIYMVFFIHYFFCLNFSIFIKEAFKIQIIKARLFFIAYLRSVIYEYTQTDAHMHACAAAVDPFLLFDFNFLSFPVSSRILSIEFSLLIDDSYWGKEGTKRKRRLKDEDLLLSYVSFFDVNFLFS